MEFLRLHLCMNLVFAQQSELSFHFDCNLLGIWTCEKKNSMIKKFKQSLMTLHCYDLMAER